MTLIDHIIAITIEIIIEVVIQPIIEQVDLQIMRILVEDFLMELKDLLVIFFVVSLFYLR
jgi:hypothetical protein